MIQWFIRLFQGFVDAGLRLFVELVRGILAAPLQALQQTPEPQEE